MRALADSLIIITADTDFGELLAVAGAVGPSVVLLRSADRLSPDEQAALLAANLPVVASELDTGAVVSIARGRLRVRFCLSTATKSPSPAEVTDAPMDLPGQ